MSGRVEEVNIDILKQCREQIGLTLEIVKKKVKSIDEIELGKKKPTFKQINTLAEMYKVPRWVFVSKTLPDQYQFDKKILSFRQFANNRADIFSDYKVRSLVAKIENIRTLIIDLLEDVDEKIETFRPPKLKTDTTAEDAANKVRKWLDLTSSVDFEVLKEKLESKDIFVFLTSKYKGWSHIDKELFRGLAIYYLKLPIIIINDSDFKKAQSFSLIHELGHLLKKESEIDNWNTQNRNVEKWCDSLAGNVLLPKKQIKANDISPLDLDGIKSAAKRCKVSPYVYIVRLRQLNIINQVRYLAFEKQLKREYKENQQKLKEKESKIPRDRPKEIIKQYGHIYIKVLLQAYHNNEIGLHKLSRLFELNNASSVFKLENRL